MTIEEAKKLQLGDRVRWVTLLRGTVRAVATAAEPSVHIHWADGEDSHLGFNNTERVWQCVRLVDRRQESGDRI